MSISRKLMANDPANLHYLLATDGSEPKDAIEITFDEGSQTLSFADTGQGGTAYAAVDKANQRYWHPHYAGAKIVKRVVNTDLSTTTTTHSYSTTTYGNPIATAYSATHDLLFFIGYDATNSQIRAISVNPDTMAVISVIDLFSITSSNILLSRREKLWVDDTNELLLFAHTRDGQFSFGSMSYFRTISFTGSTGVLGALEDSDTDGSSNAPNGSGKNVTVAVDDRDNPTFLMNYESYTSSELASQKWTWNAAGIISTSNTNYSGSYTTIVREASIDPVTGYALVEEATALSLWSPTALFQIRSLSNIKSDFPTLANIDEVMGVAFLGNSGYMALGCRDGNLFYIAIFSVDFSLQVIDTSTMTLVAFEEITAWASASSFLDTRLSYLFSNNERV